MRERFGGRIFLGGQSYGGRQTTMLAAGDESACDGLLLLSYPLHPPGRHEQMRTAHFPELRTPALFVSGTRDDFGTPEELERSIKLIPVRTRLVQISGGTHSLLNKKNAGELPSIIVSAWNEFFVSRGA
jgi:predicted alpha/beta-hydrolase family hydrolase